MFQNTHITYDTVHTAHECHFMFLLNAMQRYVVNAMRDRKS